MLQGEVWLKRLANEADIELESSLQLWSAFTATLIAKLTEGYAVLFPSIGFWSLLLQKEHLIGNPTASHLIPPQLKLSISDNNEPDLKIEITQFTDSLEAETSISRESITKWLNLIPTLTVQLLEAKQSVHYPSLGEFHSTEDSILFTEEQTFKDELNKAFSFFSPIELHEQINTDGLEHLSISLEEALSPQTITINYLISQTLPSTEETKPQEEEEEEPKQESPQEDTFIAPSKEDILEEEEGAIQTEEEHPSETNIPAEANLDYEEDIEEEEDTVQRKSSTSYLWGCLSILLLIVGAILLYLFFSNNPEQQSPIAAPPTPKVIPHREESIKAEPTQIQQDTVVATPQTDTVVKPTPQPQAPKPKQEVAKEEKKTNTQGEKPLAEEKKNTTKDIAEDIEIKADESLASLALRKYGHRAFWVYIYEENRERISNPHNLPVGTRLHLPPAKKYNIDPKNTNSINQALVLSKSI